jgi:serine/threonine protein kinase
MTDRDQKPKSKTAPQAGASESFPRETSDTSQSVDGGGRRSGRPELAAGDIIGKRYRLDEELGRGGMGVVWAATHQVTLKRVAIKFLRGPVDFHTDLRRRFLREARAACAVNHPNTVEVLDVFELDDETPVMLMELLTGETLRCRLERERRLSLAQTISILLPVVDAVSAAHALGIVHRDLKPENIFLVRDGARTVKVKVLDFGIAKLVAQEGGESEANPITGTGSMVGTPCYMAPEQTLAERDIDHRADLWSLGAILYECLAGVRPMRGSGIGQVVMQLATTGIEPIDRVVSGLPGEAAGLIMRMLARERTARPQSAQEVRDVLSGLAEEGASPPSPTLVSERTRVEDSSRRRATKAPVVDTHAPQAVSREPRSTSHRLLVGGLVAALALAAGAVAWRPGKFMRGPPQGPPSAEGVTGETVGAAASLPVWQPSAQTASTSTTSAPVLAADDAPAAPSAAPAMRPIPGQAASAPPVLRRHLRAAAPAPSIDASAPGASPPPQASQSVPAATSKPPTGGLAEKPPF